MKGELGPLAQAVAKYQMERRIQKEIDKLKAMEEKLKEIQMENTFDHNTNDQHTKDHDVNMNIHILKLTYVQFSNFK